MLLMKGCWMLCVVPGRNKSRRSSSTHDVADTYSCHWVGRIEILERADFSTHTTNQFGALPINIPTTPLTGTAFPFQTPPIAIQTQKKAPTSALHENRRGSNFWSKKAPKCVAVRVLHKFENFRLSHVKPLALLWSALNSVHFYPDMFANKTC